MKTVVGFMVVGGFSLVGGCQDCSRMSGLSVSSSCSFLNVCHAVLLQFTNAYCLRVTPKTMSNNIWGKTVVIYSMYW